MASVELLLKELELPYLSGVRLEEVVKTGERLLDRAVTGK